MCFCIIFTDVDFSEHLNMILVHVVHTVEDPPQGCCQALCAKNQSCAAVQRSKEKCLMSDRSVLLHSDIESDTNSGSVFVRNPYTPTIYTISTVNAPGLFLLPFYCVPIAI